LRVLFGGCLFPLRRDDAIDDYDDYVDDQASNSGDRRAAEGSGADGRRGHGNGVPVVVFPIAGFFVCALGFGVKVKFM
jgi:hypothetical protein